MRLTSTTCNQNITECVETAFDNRWQYFVGLARVACSEHVDSQQHKSGVPVHQLVYKIACVHIQSVRWRQS